MSATLAVEIENLHKVFPTPFKRQKVQAVKDISLQIEEGTVYGLIGPNGSGKSTTMKALLGLVRPTSGVCKIFGRNSTKTDSRDFVGFLPENPYFYKHMTGAETVRFFGKLCGMRGKSLRQRADELLDLVGLTNAADRRLGGYSKGMLQRIGLAQAIVQDPKLVILDEPTAGVDPIGSRQIRDLVFELRRQGKTVFLCSHLLEQVQEVCDRVGIVHEGEMVREGKLDELLSIDTQSEIIVENASPQLLARIQDEIEADAKASLVSAGQPRTTLESLFLKETKSGRALRAADDKKGENA